ncbi:hypothetical protein BAUCODRAFT_33056 [Baudoinia panamericana UAMH 10762]|uniref:Zn(2)-C6 fungal-type domain-containing protein n=1 Tax=Baudoinia panamericana (strain UAMH 10762) TaxID=717646 RepID=M2MKX0_BAUPA|nr:uncharacterized protein BAUCODRAFT_33056 [Baudoinia panamericana UAMH 10762]EMC97336.1 hypothetical protein BAUCODRAFT_33056 [Baudoinia panamericana UAMH 10762]
MNSQHTERACDRCRERRVKCDKTIPACLRCEKLGKPCPGYDKKRKFVDETVSLRKKYQASPLGRPSGETNADNVCIVTKAISGASFNGKSTISFASSPLSRHVASQPTLPESPPSPGQALTGGDDDIAPMPYVTTNITEVPQSLAALPSLASVTHPALLLDTNFRLPDLQPDPQYDGPLNDTLFDPAWFNLEPDEFYGSGNNSCGFIPNAPIVDEVDRREYQPSIETATATPMSGIGMLINGNMWPPEGQAKTSALIADEREHEMAYLIRHFTEALGPWMDLFDQDKHFGHLVPLKALRDALLRNAIAAVAAKQLGRVKGVKPFVGVQCQRPAMMEIIDGTIEIDWFYKAANYYDKAIAFSRLYLDAISGSLSAPSSPSTQMSLSLANSDDLLVAVSLFSLYECLDNREMGWLSHLAGLKSLLSAISAAQQDQLQIVPSITVGRKASFWNFVRADYQASYINRSKTYLDTEELPLWRSCGLEVRDDGTLYADVSAIKEGSNNCRQTAQIVAHTLLWLVLRVTNYLAQDQKLTPADAQATWDLLTAQLDAWYSNLPETFQPCAQIRYPLQMRSHRGGMTGSQLTEVFFSIDQCAASMQLYHFARILLLMNKPATSNGCNSRLKAYREVSPLAIKHAREIVGVALGRPHPAVRVEMLLPLYVAGGCLEADEERKVVLDVVRAIEKDTGCSTEVTARSLVDEWGWNEEHMLAE